MQERHSLHHEERHSLHHEATFEHEDIIHNEEIRQLKSYYHKAFTASLCFVLVISALCIYQFYSQSTIITDGQFYQQQIINNHDLEPFWKEQVHREKNKNSTLLTKGIHNISRQELGNMGWTLLHMVTGAFPDDLTPDLSKKFNAFLMLFGHLYPCKLCANHFLALLKEVGPFAGNTKLQLMTYMCQIHNHVNKRLGHKIHSCENIVDEWNTCGCSQSQL